MSISPAQMIQQGATKESTAAPRCTTQAPVLASQAVHSTADSIVPGAADSSQAKLATDVRIDDQHRIYYEVINERTGDVVCEIPTEAIRKLGEKLILPLDDHGMSHLIDTKS